MPQIARETGATRATDPHSLGFQVSFMQSITGDTGDSSWCMSPAGAPPQHMQATAQPQTNEACLPCRLCLPCKNNLDKQANQREPL